MSKVVKFNCPLCSQKLKAAANSIGIYSRCPSCDTQFLVPSLGEIPGNLPQSGISKGIAVPTSMSSFSFLFSTFAVLVPIVFTLAGCVWFFANKDDKSHNFKLNSRLNEIEKQLDLNSEDNKEQLIAFANELALMKDANETNHTRIKQVMKRIMDFESVQQ